MNNYGNDYTNMLMHNTRLQEIMEQVEVERNIKESRREYDRRPRRGILRIKNDVR